ncbi:glutamate-gated chloride channel isoform X2 [Eurytemora carolleeae]|uniref:glutamate-gated chloride channel isoform X2 n=1 Tax=Eurytemora carolleeae TaxID=1294199 RepID=UPI000C764608|nr:glutamate-gated chloride channel isoform X2 [Eurytemora carolleeae]|eukprot:XP_023336331.1 glutamate-gated chloride channel-like isoform X2 [Eurytemora affinis]
MKRASVVLLLTYCCSALAVNDYVSTQSELTHSLLERYDRHIKPDHKVNVSVNLYLRYIKEVDSVSGSMEYQLTFRQKWSDSRLSFNENPDAVNVNFLTLISGEEKQIWVPDTFFRNELEAKIHNTMVPNEYIRVYPNGDVLQSVRLTLKTTCGFNSPKTEFICPVQIASYGWTAEDVVYTWTDKPIMVAKELRIKDFSLDKYMTDYCNVKTSTGEYSCLNAEFRFTPVGFGGVCNN